MNPKSIWANLAVADLDRTDRFYTALGFTRNEGHGSPDLVSFSFGDARFVICFFRREVLQRSNEGALADAETANEVLFSISAASPQEADAWAEEVEPAGGKLLSPPRTFGNGFYGFLFADPDGHRFNVFHM